MVARYELLPIFWPEESDQTARLRLRETLGKLRKGLPQDDLLITKDELISLNFEKTYVDLLEFHDLTTQVGRLPWKISPEEPLPDPLYRRLLSAYQIWRSPNFLAGAKFSSSLWQDAWFSNTVNYNENLYREIVERLSDHETATGNLENALNLARQALVNHEYEEELQVRVLRLMVQLGHHIDARNYFKKLESYYKKEMNSMPCPELIQLYQQIRIDTRPIANKGFARWNIHPSMQVHFVGRQKYLSVLHGAYQKGGGFFLLGESGQGKTRLLQEFTSQLQPPPRLLLAHCRPVELNLPFQPLIDVLRQNLSPKEWLELPRVWANQLQILFPELSMLRSDLIHLSEANPEQSRPLLFEALRQICLILCKSQHLILILDDGQWADEVSLSAIAYLLERPPFDKKAFLIVAARLEEKNPPLEKLLGLLKPSRGPIVLHLPQMELNEIDDLTRQVLGSSASPHFVARLAQDTGGNPFFILETLHALVKEGPNVDLEGLRALPMAESIYELIQNRVHSLSPRARSILEIAALVGTEFRTHTLISASELSEEEVALSLDELEERILIVRTEQNDQAPQYRFMHDRVREAILFLINPLRFQIAHRKIAFALQEEDGQITAQAAVLAHHFEAAEEWYLAYQYWIKAGTHARHLYAVSEASRAFQNAEKLIDRCIGSLEDDQIYTLYREWGEMAYASNDTPALQAMNTNLMRLGERLQSPLLKGTALVRLGNACFSSGNLGDGTEYTRLAIDQLSHTDNIYQLTGARMNYGIFLYMSGHVTQALQVLESALQMIFDKEDGDLISQRASLNYGIGMCLLLNGMLRKSITFGLQCLKDYGRINNLGGISSAYIVLTLASYFLGDYPSAFQYCHQGMENAHQSQSWRMLGYHYGNRAMLELATGNLDAMLEFAEKAIDLGHQIGQSDICITGYRLLSDAFYLMENYQKSLEHLQLAYAEGHESFLALDTFYRLRSVQFILERKEDYIQDLQNVVQQTDAGGLITGKLLAQTSLVMAYRGLGKWNDAKDLGNAIKEAGLSKEFRSLVIAANLILAQCEWQAGNHSEAFTYLQQCVQEAESIPFVWLEIMGRVSLNQFYQQTSQPSETNRQRIHQLLEHLQNNCQKSFFQPSLRDFKHRIEQFLA